MLVLSMKLEDEIIVTRGNDQFLIKLCRLGPGKIRLGIDAPEDFEILRRAVYQKYHGGDHGGKD